MQISQLVSRFDITNSCRKYGLSVWQCPHFLFLVMGMVIMASIVLSYAIGSRYIEDPMVVALLTLVLAGVLLIIAFAITNNFEKLAETSRLKSEFVSIVSHQLRSPLSNLQWGLEVLLSGRAQNTTEKETGYLRILKENSDRMQELVKNLLVVSRIQEGTLKFSKEEFSFKELLKTILSEFDPWIRASNMSVELQGAENLPKIFSDQELVRQIVQNFLENAIRYGKSTISLRASLSNSMLRFEVRDNGVGIPQEDQKFIFQKFFRASNVRRHETQGSGLGLYIAKSFIEKLGGKIGFVSTVNKGSTFWFTIPIAKPS